MPYANNKGIKIHYEVEGEGPTVMMVHGFMGSFNDWYEAGYVKALKDNYRLVLVDLIAHGMSDKPHDPEVYTLEECAGDLMAVLNDLDIGSAHVMGYSGGGVHCVILASQAKEMIKSMILIASGPNFSGGDQVKPLLENGSEAYISAIEQSGPIPDTFKERIMAADFKALMAIFDSPIASVDLSNDLPGMPMPFLVLIGENDIFYPPQKQKELFKAVPDLTFIELPGLNHGTSINRSDITLPYITEFLARVA